MILHSIGDSHAEWPWKKLSIQELEIKYYIQPSTCGAMIFRRNEFSNIFLNIKEGDAVCFTLGEIDCRHHIEKVKANYKEMIIKIIDSYFKEIAFQISKYRDLTVIVSCIVPPRRKKYFEPTGVTWLGKDSTRKTFVLFFNDTIREYCAKYDYYCLDLYTHYIGIDGFINDAQADSFMHIMDSTYLSNELKEIFGL